MNPLCVNHYFSSHVSCAMYLSSNHVVEFLAEVRNQHFCNTCMWNSFALVYKCFRRILAPTFYDVIFLASYDWLHSKVLTNQNSPWVNCYRKWTSFTENGKAGTADGNSKLFREEFGANVLWRHPHMTSCDWSPWRDCPIETH